jgi:hypothetical protein
MTDAANRTISDEHLPARLRAFIYSDPIIERRAHEAADEIERLRAALSRIAESHQEWGNTAGDHVVAFGEIREALS